MLKQCSAPCHSNPWAVAFDPGSETSESSDRQDSFGIDSDCNEIFDGGAMRVGVRDETTSLSKCPVEEKDAGIVVLSQRYLSEL